MAGAIETPEFLAAHLDKWGSPQAYNHYAVGWAWAMDTPYQWTKQVASHWGGTRNGTIVHWPKGIEEKGGLRTQFSHVIDVAPTVLEAAGIPEPIQMHGVTQSPYEGTSMLYSFNAKDEPERHDVQYFEMFCNRGIYYKGWSAVTRHSTPWTMSAQMPAFDDDTWELYDGSTDWTQAHDLAKENPEMLAQAAACIPDRGHQVQCHPAGRSPCRAFHPRNLRATDAGQGQQADLLPRHETHLGSHGPRREEQVVPGDGPDRRA